MTTTQPTLRERCEALIVRWRDAAYGSDFSDPDSAKATAASPDELHAPCLLAIADPQGQIRSLTGHTLTTTRTGVDLDEAYFRPERRR